MPVLSHQSKVLAAAALAVVVAAGAVLALTRRSSTQVSSLPMATAPIQMKPAVIALSKWSEALAKKGHRRLVSYDPGMTGGAFVARACKDCDGMGGHYIPEKLRSKGDSDMTTCDTCQGSGDAGVD